MPNNALNHVTYCLLWVVIRSEAHLLIGSRLPLKNG